MHHHTKSLLLAAALLLFSAISSSLALAQCGWDLRTEAISGGFGLAVAINPRNANTVFAGGGQIAVSHDRGRTWRASPLPSGARDVRMIFIHPVDTTNIFIGGSQNGVWKSSDAGATWKLVLPNPTFDGVSIVADPLHPDTMHLGSFGQGFYSSFDRGETWRLINSNMGRFCSMAIRPDSSHVLLGGTSTGTVSKSTDYGRTWRVVTARAAFEVPLVAFDPIAPDNVYASVFGVSNDYGVIKSRDGGETWQGLGLFGEDIWAFAVAPSASHYLYAGGFNSDPNSNSGGKVFFSEDGGSSWRAIAMGLPPRGAAWMLAVSPENRDDVYLAMHDEVGVNRAGLYKLLSKESPPFAPQELTIQETGTGTTALLRWRRAVFCEAPIARYLAFHGTSPTVYSDSTVAGLDTTTTLSRLQEGSAYYATVVAVDTAGRRSNIATPVSFIPQSVPAAPSRLAFQRKLRGAGFTWPPNLELDLAGYNLYRAVAGVHVFEKVNAAIIADTAFTEAGLSFQKYFYYVVAVDRTGLESLPSPLVALRPITLEKGMVLLDDTRDGNGSLIAPTDAQVDEHYQRLLAGFDHEDYDVARSGVPDDTLGIYAMLIWHMDVLGSGNLKSVAPFLAQYLDAGGKLLLSGWNVMRNFSNSAVQVFGEKDFPAQYLHLDTSWVVTQPQFEAAQGAQTEYGVVPVEAAKVFVPAWNGRLRDVNVFAFGDDAEAVYEFAAADTAYSFHGRPVGVKHISNRHRVMVLGFPLYFMKEEPGRNALRTILDKDFGYAPLSLAQASSETPRAFGLSQNHPNPWTQTTRVRFEAPHAGRITLEVFDLLGKILFTVVDDDFAPGAHEVVMANRFPAAGIYFYRLTLTRNGRKIQQQTRKMLVVR
jgi:photosystem II stability/assembly factor-like uncharacterized protein